MLGKQKPTVYDAEDHDLGLALCLLGAPVISGSFSPLVIEHSVLPVQFVNLKAMQFRMNGANGNYRLYTWPPSVSQHSSETSRFLYQRLLLKGSMINYKQ